MDMLLGHSTCRAVPPGVSRATISPALQELLLSNPPIASASLGPTIPAGSFPHSQFEQLIKPLIDEVKTEGLFCGYRRLLACSSAERRHGIVGLRDSPFADMLNLRCMYITIINLLDGTLFLVAFLTLMMKYQSALLIETLVTVQSFNISDISLRLLRLKNAGTQQVDREGFAYLARMYATAAAGLINFIRVRNTVGNEVTRTAQIAYLRSCDLIATEWMRFAGAALRFGDLENHPTPDGLIAVGLILQYPRINWAGENMDTSQSLVGSAIKLVKKLGLHRDPEDSDDVMCKNGNTFELRVITHQLTIIEWTTNNLQCRRWGLDPVFDFTVKHPSEHGDMPRIYMFTLKSIVASIAQTINIVFSSLNCPATPDWTMKIEKELQEVMTKPPSRYQARLDVATKTINRSADLTEAELFDLYAFILNVCSIGMRLHRGLLSRATGVSAAHVAYHRGRLLYYCQFVFCIWKEKVFPSTYMPAHASHLAAAVALSVYVLTPIDGEDVDAALLNDIHTASRVLEPIVKLNNALSRSHSVLVSLVRKISCRRNQYQPSIRTTEVLAATASRSLPSPESPTSSSQAGTRLRTTSESEGPVKKARIEEPRSP